MEPIFQPEIGQNGFEEFEKENQYVDAGNWKRLANNIIDGIVITLIQYVLLFLFGLIITSTTSGSLNYLLEFVDESNLNLRLLDYFIQFVISLSYYSFFESFTGISLGKLITKTKVIDEETNVCPTFKVALIRSLCRFIPFEPFSFFGSSPGGWHDRISKTRVVNA